MCAASHSSSRAPRAGQCGAADSTRSAAQADVLGEIERIAPSAPAKANFIATVQDLQQKVGVLEIDAGSGQAALITLEGIAEQ